MTFDWKNPDYTTVFRQRAARLQRLRAEPSLIVPLKAYYRDHPADFISDWGCTFDPRNADIGLPPTIPFVLYKRQREWIDWAMARWKEREFGVNPKSRELGVSWLAMSLSCTLCLFHREMAIGFGSNKIEQVDEIGNPKSLFEKGRTFLSMLPPEFSPEFETKFKLIRLANGSTISGEGGDNIGRGGRTAIYFVDEAAHLERPMKVEASLSQTTNCRIDISSANGMANPFFLKQKSWPSSRVFYFHWREDPRKDDAWYEKQEANLDPVTLAQEVNIDFSASVEGVVIPSAWIQASVDAHVALGIEPTGAKRGALDVADEGRDLNAFAACHGIVVTHLEEWSGAGSDIFRTTQRAFSIADQCEVRQFEYDADGLGAGVRGDANVINGQRLEIKRPAVAVVPYRGSGAVSYPDASDVKGRLNKDFYRNLKAQRWWGARRRFEQTWRAVRGEAYDPSMIISLPSDLPLLTKLMGELSQPTYSEDATGKLVIDKVPDGARSPNLADAVIILMGATRRGLVISEEAMAASMGVRR